MLSHFSHVWLCNPMDCSPLTSSVHGILQARIQEWVAMPSSRRSSQPQDRTQIFHIPGRFFTIWATREFQEYWSGYPISFPGDLPHPEMEPGSPALQADSLPAELPGKPRYYHRLIPIFQRMFFRELRQPVTSKWSITAWNVRDVFE